MRQAIRALLQS